MTFHRSGRAFVCQRTDSETAEEEEDVGKQVNKSTECEEASAAGLQLDDAMTGRGGLGQQM